MAVIGSGFDRTVVSGRPRHGRSCSSQHSLREWQLKLLRTDGLTRSRVWSMSVAITTLNCQRVNGIMLEGVAKLSKNFSFYCQSVRAKQQIIERGIALSHQEFYWKIVRMMAGNEGRIVSDFALQVSWPCHHRAQKLATVFKKRRFL